MTRIMIRPKSDDMNVQQSFKKFIICMSFHGGGFMCPYCGMSFWEFFFLVFGIAFLAAGCAAFFNAFLDFLRSRFNKSRDKCPGNSCQDK